MFRFKQKNIFAVAGLILTIVLFGLDANHEVNERLSEVAIQHQTYKKTVEMIMTSAEYSSKCTKAVAELHQAQPKSMIEINTRLLECTSDFIDQFTVIFDDKGNQTFASFASYFVPKISISDRPYFKEAIKGKLHGWYGPYASRNTERPAFANWQRISSDDFDGIAVAVLSLTFMDDQCKIIQRDALVQSLLVTDEGKIVTSCLNSITRDTNFNDSVLKGRLKFSFTESLTTEIDNDDFRILVSKINVHASFYVVTLIDKTDIMSYVLRVLVLKIILFVMIVMLIIFGIRGRSWTF